MSIICLDFNCNLFSVVFLLVAIAKLRFGDEQALTELIKTMNDNITIESDQHMLKITKDDLVIMLQLL